MSELVVCKYNLLLELSKLYLNCLRLFEKNTEKAMAAYICKHCLPPVSLIVLFDI